MLSTKRVVSFISISRSSPLFLWRSSRTAAHPSVLSGLDLLVSLVSWIAAMLTLLLRRKVSSSVISPLIPFAFHCISRIQLVSVGFETGPYRRHTEADVGAAVPASTTSPPKGDLRVEKVQLYMYIYIIRSSH